MLARRRKAGTKRKTVKSSVVSPVTVKVKPLPKVEKKAKVDIDYSGAEDTVVTTITKGNTEVVINMNVANTPHCCGLFEMGDFYMSDEDDWDEDDEYNDGTTADVITDAERVSAIKQALKLALAENTRGTMCRTLVFTLIDNPVCNLIRLAVDDGKLFTPVKTFTNMNSHTENTLYVSNN